MSIKEWHTRTSLGRASADERDDCLMSLMSAFWSSLNKSLEFCMFRKLRKRPDLGTASGIIIFRLCYENISYFNLESYIYSSDTVHTTIS